jgi:hypothetical protein
MIGLDYLKTQVLEQANEELLLEEKKVLALETTIHQSVI